ncbi:1-aminocyclopropane-1-carboxylate deaminase [Methylomonas lenta]|uniref:1-aminocyclopropane-1-carboxylate deaminase n=1 Tax=Methylomonas lenta TaxID=980561 RepID=A0A177N8Z5_9GAMM|nr:pyridoxal-phosphate dependent enzyme [Methylomonas lenta]OAI14365.1 1-aminocyclopropane-1-carboxylate deaminase [Methylomonas lenta]
MGNQTGAVINLHPRLEALEKKFSASPLTQILDQALSARRVELWIKRDDLLHPIISGNKWRKLKYNLNHALNNQADTLISMGGAYSNHLHALAFAGQQLGLKTVAFVRGERPAQLNPTLIDLQQWGMQLNFVSRSDYRQLRQYKNYHSLPDLVSGQYWLPEGGASDLALQGVAEIMSELKQQFDLLMVACGTGATLAGLITAAPVDMQILGVAALKGGDFLNADVKQLLPQAITQQNWQILLDYHFGGFAKYTPELKLFMHQFAAKHGVALDPIYTGKLLFAFYDLLNQGYFKPGQRILLLHTGGLQGARD